MNDGKICISICSTTSEEMLRRVHEAAALADLIELRLDCLPASATDALFANLPKLDSQYLITFRPRDQGGHSDASRTDRLKFWSYALEKLKDHDFLVDYEADIDFPLQLGAERAIVSLHDFDRTVADLPLQFDVLSGLTGKTIKIAVGTDDIIDSLEVWKLLDKAEHVDKKLIPIAMGGAGKWTRILGLAYGAPITYASLGGAGATAPGQISARDLRDVFRAKELDRNTSVYGVIAEDTSYSLSPYMHNTAFKTAGLNSVFLPLQVSDLDAFMRRMVKSETREVELNFAGFSVTNPHKQTIIDHLDEIDDTARKIGAVNTVKLDKGKSRGFNTDAPGFISPLKNAFGDLNGARVAIVGAGGAARACVFALTQEGADVTLLARDPKKAAVFAEEFGITVSKLITDDLPLTTDILVNTTPLGTKGEKENETIATAENLRGVKLVYDLVYNPSETRLLREAKSAGARTLGGLDMLVAQGVRQFQIWTGREAPVDEMRAAVEKRLR